MTKEELQYWVDNLPFEDRLELKMFLWRLYKISGELDKICKV